MLEMGTLGVRLLLQRLKDKTLDKVETIELQPELIERATTKVSQ